MEYEKLVSKYIKGKSNIFITVSIFSIVGYLIDYLIFGHSYTTAQKAYHILSFLLCVFALIMYYVEKRKRLEFYFNLVAYTAIINIFITHIFYHSFLTLYNTTASIILARDLFFVLCYTALSGFISNRKHIIIQSLILISLLVFYILVLQDPFYIENGPVYVLVVIGFSIVMFFFTSIVKESIDNFKQSHLELMVLNNELVEQSEKLKTALINLQNTQNQLVQSEKMASLGILAAGVAHEINNPLNYIQGGVFGIEQYLHDHFKDHINEVAPLIDCMKEGIKRSADIVTSLNHFSRQSPKNDEQCNIHAIIESCLVMLNNKLKNKVEVIKNYTLESVVVLGNEGKLHQVFLNILVNSIQAIEDKGYISISTKSSEHSLTISIKDNGAGISKENLSKVSDPFFTTKDTGNGVGLGLSIVYNIIAEHNGTIEFISEQGSGTEIMITLPFQ